MTRKTKIWLIALALLSIYLIAAWFAGMPLGLRGRDLWILRGALWLAGLVVAGVSIWLLTRQTAAAADRGAAASRVEGIEATLPAAQRQLASARLTAGSAIGKFPLVLLVGPEGSAKTTMVVRSGLEPELLAGEVFRGEAVAPTRAVNVWYSSDTIFVEAGGNVLAESAAWTRLLRHVRPKRLASVLTGRAHAPRVAVVCFSCEELVKPSNSEVVLAAARSLRERLTEASRQLGVRLPVYVLFTKADRIAYFPDYVQNLSNEEAREVLGATLASDTGAAGAYADRQSKRLNGVLQRLFL